MIWSIHQKASRNVGWTRTKVAATPAQILGLQWVRIKCTIPPSLCSASLLRCALQSSGQPHQQCEASAAGAFVSVRWAWSGRLAASSRSVCCSSGLLHLFADSWDEVWCTGTGPIVSSAAHSARSMETKLVPYPSNMLDLSTSRAAGIAAIFANNFFSNHTLRNIDRSLPKSHIRARQSRNTSNSISTVQHAVPTTEVIILTEPPHVASRQVGTGVMLCYNYRLAS